MAYHSQASANGQSIRGSWMTVSDRAKVAEVALFGVVMKAELSEYGNQKTALFNAWKEQGVCNVALQSSVTLVLSAEPHHSASRLIPPNSNYT
jgi:hypothetical protein